MGKKSTPQVPDYRGAAEQTANSQNQQVLNQTYANRPNVQTPWGSMTWDTQMAIDPGTGRRTSQWFQNLNLNDADQAALESQQRIGASRSGLAESLLSRAYSEFGSPRQGPATSWADIPQADQETRQRAEDAIYGRLTSRLDPMWQQNEAQIEAKLRNKGLRPGEAAYNQEYDNLMRAKNDAYQGAGYQSVMGGGEEMARQFGMELQGAGFQNQQRQAQIAEELQSRGWSLNEINALISGQQIAQPTMPGFNMASMGAGTNYTGAAQNTYQGNLDNFNASNMATQGLLSGVSSFMPFNFGQA